jgi:hypothetical protein
MTAVKFDTLAFLAEVNKARQTGGRTWSRVCDEAGVQHASVIRAMRGEHGIARDTLLGLSKWAQVDPLTFTTLEAGA